MKRHTLTFWLLPAALAVSAALVPAISAAAGPDREPVVGCVPIAHRAGPTLGADENTVEAIERDGKLGAWAEVDLRRLRAGGFVLVHDNTLQRTTDGWGVVEEQSLAYIGSIRTEPNGQEVPTFRQALLAAKESGATLYVELKKYEVLYWEQQDLRTLARMVRKQGMVDQIYFGGTRGALNDLRDLTPRLKTFWRTKNNDAVTVVEARKRSVDVIQTTPARVTAASVEELRAAGYTVAAQSLNGPDEWLKAAGVGITMVQTNMPRRFKDWCKLNT